MKLSKRWLKALSDIKGNGKIKDFEVVAGGVILKCNGGYSIIAKNMADLETNLAQICYEEAEKC